MPLHKVNRKEADEPTAPATDKAKSTVPAFGYPVPYAVSTVVFLIYGYLAMVLS